MGDFYAFMYLLGKQYTVAGEYKVNCIVIVFYTML